MESYGKTTFIVILVKFLSRVSLCQIFLAILFRNFVKQGLVMYAV